MIDPRMWMWVFAFLGMCTSILYDFLLKVNEQKLKLSQFDWRYLLTTFVGLVPVALEVRLFLGNIVDSIVAQGMAPGNAYIAAFTAGFSTEHIIKKKLEKLLW
ncbi:MAG: hypothetical protein N2V78_09245 [Methanophagales archaeon]|nr:hypothetical protein [Methanophagales archaeon]